MAIEQRAFGFTPTDEVVKAWLSEHGSDPRYVIDYRISRSANGVPTLEITFLYDESAKEKA